MSEPYHTCTRASAGQLERGVRHHCKEEAMKQRYAWVLIDLSNSNPRSRNYLWWFETRALARDHRRRQHEMKHGAKLSQPQRWIRDA